MSADTKAVAWLTANAPDGVLEYVAQRIQERDVALVEYATLNGIARRHEEQSEKLADAIGAIGDIAKGSKVACSCSVNVEAIKLGLKRSL